MEAFDLRLWDARIGRWLTTDPENIHYSPYLGMANNPVNTIDPDGGEPTDWIRLIGTDTWVWHEDVVGKDMTPEGYEYGGATRADVINAWGFNTTEGFEGFWNRNFGSGHGQKFDEFSFTNGKFGAFSKNVIEAQRNVKAIPLSKADLKYNEELKKKPYGGWGLDKREPGVSKYAKKIDFLAGPYSDTGFSFDIDVNGEPIHVIGDYSKTLEYAQYASQILKGSWVPYNSFTGHSNYSFLIGNKHKNNVIILSFKSHDDYHKLHDYIFN